MTTYRLTHYTKSSAHVIEKQIKSQPDAVQAAHDHAGVEILWQKGMGKEVYIGSCFNPVTGTYDEYVVYPEQE